MMDSYDAAIETIRNDIAARMRTVNDLCKLKGQPPMYPDADGAAGVTSGKIRPDQWYTVGISTAAREFLAMRQQAGVGPATLDEIYSALVSGGFKFESRDEPAAKAALKQSLTKNSIIFHRLPNGLYGLQAWYPNHKANEEEKEKARGASKKKRLRLPKPAPHRERLPGEEAAKLFFDAPNSAGTLAEAVKQGIKAMPTEFTKQDVLDWVNLHRPDLGARKESVYVTVTRLREEMGLVTSKESKGRELSTYRKETVEAVNGSK